MENLIDTLKMLPINDRIIILSDIASIKHSFSVKESLDAYRKLRMIFENSDFMNLSQNHRKLFSICEDNLFNLRSSLGVDAMILLNEDEKEDEKEREKEQKEIEKKNKEEFEKESEKRKKAEQEPIAKILRAKGDSQNDAASNLDVHKSTISRWKTGTRNPSFENMKDLKDVYGAGVVNQILSDE